MKWVTLMNNDKPWEEAFIRFGVDAATGRLFKGLIHNLNGVGQVFSMQAELLGMMFEQADETLSQITGSDNLPEAIEKAGKLKEMMARRAGMIRHLDNEVRILQQIMQRVNVLMDESRAPDSAHPFKIEEVIRDEIEFLNADSFFKHKVKKTVDVFDGLPVLNGCSVEIHQIIAAMLENAAQAMAGIQQDGYTPELHVESLCEGRDILVKVSDNGAGFGFEDTEMAFEPFYTTKKGHLGMGLYLARIMAGRFGGTLTGESRSDCTRFILGIPAGEVWR